MITTFMRVARRLARTRIVDVAQLHGLQETHHLRRLFHHLSVDLVFDIGANHGQYAQRLRRQVGYKGPIVSIEPIPELASGLRERVKSDPFWHVEELVVSDLDGSRSFNVMRDRECSSLSVATHEETPVYSAQTETESTILVRSVTLRTLMNSWADRYPEAKRAFLKLDTQGYDLHILKAAESELGKFVAFQSELSVKRLYESGTGLEETLKQYRGFGFDVSALVPNNSGHFPDLIEIDCIMVRRDLVAKNE